MGRLSAQVEELKGIIEGAEDQSQWITNINGNQFLRYEAWLVIADLNNQYPRIEWTKPIRKCGKIVGYEARALLINDEDDRVISSVDAMCTVDERRQPLNSVRSMAQTRAMSKVIRSVHGHVSVMMGYRSTPAEEMGHLDRPRGRSIIVEE